MTIAVGTSMAEHRACHGCLDGCTRESAVHCVSCVAVQAWPCDAQLLTEEVDRLNRLVETLSRALQRYQDEEAVHPAGSHPFIPLSGSQDTGGNYTRCSVIGCTRTRIQHPGEW